MKRIRNTALLDNNSVPFNVLFIYLVEQGVFVGARGEDQARENGAGRND